MQPIIDAITQGAIEILVVLLAALASYVAKQAGSYLRRAKKLKDIQILDKVSDDIVDYVQAQFSGANGEKKQQIAAQKIAEVLNEQGVKVSEIQILAGIENGVKKVKEKNVFGQK